MAETGGELRPATTADALEGVIALIPGVRAVRVVDAGDRITEVHIIATTDRSPKQFVRDIQSVAKASLDIDLDYRTVSIVQLTDEQAPAGRTQVADEPRMPLVRVVFEATGQLASVEVVLADHAGERSGRVRGSVGQRAQLIARATLEAFLPRLGDAVPEVRAAEVVDVAGMSVAVVLVRLASREGLRDVSGSAPVTGDPDDALARATLDAVNRVRA